MKVAVVIAGVLDPKWPIALDPKGVPQTLPDRVVMSPFDESALETALRIRDRDPVDTDIYAIVCGPFAGEKIARAVAAFRIEDVTILALPFTEACDINWGVTALARAISSDTDLVLTGRELGDCDDGTMPPLLAATLGLPFFGRVQDFRSAPTAASLMREAQSEEEEIAVGQRLVCSVTNDRRNRLRKPLMKNVIATRTLKFASIVANGRSVCAFGHMTLVVDVRRPMPCEMVHGSPAEMAAALANHIREFAA